MGDLAQQIDEARAALERLQRQAKGATCAEMGEHDMKHVGGCNAACGEDCCCSVPVHKCTRCGDSDYGENDEAREVRETCAERRSWGDT